MNVLLRAAIAAGGLCAAVAGPAVAQADAGGSAAAFSVVEAVDPTLAPGTRTIDFDDVEAPCLFSQTVALRRFEGVGFKGKSAGGGAILDDCDDLGVSGYSPPNVLAFDCSQTLASGRRPRLPETLNFGRNDVAPGLTFKIGSSGSAGRFLRVTATNAEGGWGAVNLFLTSALQTIEAHFPINKLMLSSANSQAPVCQLVLDDLTFSRP
jgi:hypothetical protein